MSESNMVESYKEIEVSCPIYHILKMSRLTHFFIV